MFIYAILAVGAYALMQRRKTIAKQRKERAIPFEGQSMEEEIIDGYVIRDEAKAPLTTEMENEDQHKYENANHEALFGPFPDRDSGATIDLRPIENGNWGYAPARPAVVAPSANRLI